MKIVTSLTFLLSELGERPHVLSSERYPHPDGTDEDTHDCPVTRECLDRIASKHSNRNKFS